jgi:hypothetical protein
METEVISAYSMIYVCDIHWANKNLMWVELLINSYFNIVKREMIDMVPKSITYTLVNFCKDGLHNELLKELYKPEVLNDLMKESEHIVARRKEVVTMIGALNKAEEYVVCPSTATDTCTHTFLCVQDCRQRLSGPRKPFISASQIGGDEEAEEHEEREDGVWIVDKCIWRSLCFYIGYNLIFIHITLRDARPL